jgi:hypothetical protein
MGTPWMGFLQDEFKWSRSNAALSFGLIVLVLGLPTVLFFNQGVFDEYDYWAGTVSLVVFALAETILFAWVFGMDKGWKEINDGADLKVPGFYRFIIKWVTPFLLIFVFVGSLIGPAGGDWGASLTTLGNGGGWNLDNGSIIAQIMNKGLKEQIAASTDPAVVAQLKEKIIYINGARLLLLAVFATASYLVFVAYKKRIREGRFS